MRKSIFLLLTFDFWNFFYQLSLSAILYTFDLMMFYLL